LQEDLTHLESHFAFGKNWAAYAEKISDAEIDEAVSGLARLLGDINLTGKRFLDIGCGSGLHSLAALRLGAREVVALDIDRDSVNTARAVLARHAPDANSTVKQCSVFDLDKQGYGEFDIVYSWGVLHHTGDMYRALASAASSVKPGGHFVFALYRKTWLCPLWRLEKRWYTKASERAQRVMQAIYVALFRMGLRFTGRQFVDYVRNYHGNRGMDFYHDVHDWLGGYPYESITPSETERFMCSLGFAPILVSSPRGRLFGRSTGVFGSGCDEFAYRHTGSSGQA
jgi:2-polyprenyl-3-methyl-5-hydroxy-6-metoxy-1,4-benzoquinol methylase